MSQPDRETKNAKKFVHHMLDVTLRLVQLDSGRKPEGIASGFLIPSGKSCRVISVGHAIGSFPRWMIETVPVSREETLGILVTKVRTIHTWRTEKQEYDLAWSDLDLEHLTQKIRADPKHRGLEVNLQVYRGPLGTPPDKEEHYGFASWSKANYQPLRASLRRKAVYELGMQFTGVDAKTGLYEFRLARRYQGSSYYEGASGSPIAGRDGRIVSMVVAGAEGVGTIYGAPLAKFAGILKKP